MAGEVWDWPNQQVVRSDETGPGWDTPVDSPTGAYITFGHAGLNYEFLLLTSGNDPVSGHGTVDWEFGDGATATGLDSTVPATHTYAAEGTYSVRARIGQAVRSMTVDTDTRVLLLPSPTPEPQAS